MWLPGIKPEGSKEPNAAIKKGTMKDPSDDGIILCYLVKFQSYMNLTIYCFICIIAAKQWKHYWKKHNY